MCAKQREQLTREEGNGRGDWAVSYSDQVTALLVVPRVGAKPARVSASRLYVVLIVEFVQHVLPLCPTKETHHTETCEGTTFTGKASGVASQTNKEDRRDVVASFCCCQG